MNYAVLGSFFGDEGKGQTVHNLCKEVSPQMVVRFCGGHQVGHTVRMRLDVGYVEHVFSNFGSGTLLGVPTYWSKFCTVDPAAARIEYEELSKLGFTPKIYYNPECEVVLPYDRVEQITDKVNLAHGTVGTGFKKCLDRANAGYHLTVIDCLNLNVLRCKVMAILLNYYNHFDRSAIAFSIDQWCIDTYDYFNSVGIMSDDDLYWTSALVFEGSQGILLDQTHGIMPYCTPSNTTCKNIEQILNRAVVPVYVTRPYITRHGAGPIPSTKKVIEVNDPNNPFNDFQKTMRAVEFDSLLFRHSMLINSSTHGKLLSPQVVVTHADECPEFRIELEDVKIRYFIYEEEVYQN